MPMEYFLLECNETVYWQMSHIYLFIAFGVHLLYVIVWDYTTEQKMNSFFNLLIVQNQLII